MSIVTSIQLSQQLDTKANSMVAVITTVDKTFQCVIEKVTTEAVIIGLDLIFMRNHIRSNNVISLPKPMR